MADVAVVDVAVLRYAACRKESHHTDECRTK